LLGTPVPIKPTRIMNDIAYYGINTETGVWSTPVIDADIGVLYVLNSALEPDGQPVFRLNAIDLVTGQARHPAQAVHVLSSDQPPYSAFDPAEQKQRAALLLSPLRQTGKATAKKAIFMACGLSHEGAAGRHGWVIAFDPDTLRATASWCTTPHGSGGGIWQAGQGPSADDQGNVYVMTSNGDMETQKRSFSLFFGQHLLSKYDFNELIDPTATDFAECFVKLRSTPPAAGADRGSLDVAGWWCPYHDSDRKVSMTTIFRIKTSARPAPCCRPEQICSWARARMESCTSSIATIWEMPFRIIRS
jgi:hypothetical protein